MTRTRCTLILFLTIALGLLSVPIQAQDNAEDVPYIYYYSPEESAFIIEKADGTDRHILTNYTFPPNDELNSVGWIIGPGWSPSGEWFAWKIIFTRNGVPNTVPSPLSEAFIISRDGATTILLNNNRPNGVTEVSMQWSPQDDLLLVNGRFIPYLEGTDVPDIYGANSETKIYVIDPETQEVIVEYLSSASTRWSSDSRFIFLNTYNSESRTFDLSSLSLDGTATHYQTHPSSYCWRDAINWSKNGKIFYKSAENTLVLTDTISGESHEFETPIDDSIIYTDWSPDTEHALVYIVSECTSDGVHFNLGAN